MKIVFGLIILAIVFGAYHAFAGMFAGPYDNEEAFEETMFGLKIIAVAMCAMMTALAISLIFGGAA